MNQTSFFEEIDLQEGITHEENSVIAHTGNQPPHCVSVKADTWLCPNCHPGGKWAKDKTGFGCIGGTNIFRCHYCGYTAVMRYTIQHTGHRTLVPEVTLAYQALDPTRAWRTCVARSKVMKHE